MQAYDLGGNRLLETSTPSCRKFPVAFEPKIDGAAVP